MTSLKGKPESDLQGIWAFYEKDLFGICRELGFKYVEMGDTFVLFHGSRMTEKKYRIEIKEVK